MIIYASEYGTTKELAGTLATLLDCSFISIQERDTVESKFLDEEYLVIMSDIIFMKINRKLKAFLKKNQSALLKKKIIFVLVCGTIEEKQLEGAVLGTNTYLKSIPKQLVENACHIDALYGKIDFEINEKHRHLAKVLRAEFLIEPFDRTFENDIQVLADSIRQKL